MARALAKVSTLTFPYRPDLASVLMTVSRAYSAYDTRFNRAEIDAFDHVVVPALDIYKPELILVSSGYGTFNSH